MKLSVNFACCFELSTTCRLKSNGENIYISLPMKDNQGGQKDQKHHDSNYSSGERIQRKQRDRKQLIGEHGAKTVQGSASTEPKPLTSVQIFAKAIEEQDGDSIQSKKMYKVSDKDIAVRWFFNILAQITLLLSLSLWNPGLGELTVKHLGACDEIF